MVKFSAKICSNAEKMRKNKNDIKLGNARCYLLEESLELLFPHSAKPYMVAESSITTKKKEISHQDERQTYDGLHVNQLRYEVTL